MLRWAVACFILAFVAALIGFGGLVASAASIGKVLFFGFVVVGAATLLAGILHNDD